MARGKLRLLNLLTSHLEARARRRSGRADRRVALRRRGVAHAPEPARIRHFAPELAPVERGGARARAARSGAREAAARARGVAATPSVAPPPPPAAAARRCGRSRGRSTSRRASSRGAASRVAVARGRPRVRLAPRSARRCAARRRAHCARRVRRVARPRSLDAADAVRLAACLAWFGPERLGPARRRRRDARRAPGRARLRRRDPPRAARRLLLARVRGRRRRRLARAARRTCTRTPRCSATARTLAARCPRSAPPRDDRVARVQGRPASRLRERRPRRSGNARRSGELRILGTDY